MNTFTSYIPARTRPKLLRLHRAIGVHVPVTAMAKDVSVLRLRSSKLSCYVEFNKMVQSIAQHKDKVQPPNVGLQSDTRGPGSGTGAEYSFFCTLFIMLNQVVNNNDIESQKRDLQLIYRWFSINKPLIYQHVKPNAHKPKLAYSSPWESTLMLSRPVCTSTSSHQQSSPACPPPTPSTNTFTSTYVKHCFSPSASRNIRVHTQTTNGSQEYSEPKKPWHNTCHTSSECSLARIASGISIVELPTSSFDRPVTAGSVFNMATSIAAEMALERITIQSRPRLYTIRTTPKHELCLTPQQQIPAEFVVATHTRREESQPVCVEETDAKSPICSERNVIMPEQLTIHVRDGTHCSQDMAMADKKRRTVHPHIVTLPVEHGLGCNGKMHRTRTPKPLIPVVAGFSKRRYRKISVQ